MIVEYTGRQTAVTEKYRVQAEAGLARTERVLGKPSSAHIILTVDKYRKIAEVAVTQGSQILVAVCEAVEMTTALHDALAKVEQQAVRHRQKTTTSMRHPKSGSKATPAADAGLAAGAA